MDFQFYFIQLICYSFFYSFWYYFLEFNKYKGTLLLELQSDGIHSIENSGSQKSNIHWISDEGTHWQLIFDVLVQLKQQVFLHIHIQLTIWIWMHSFNKSWVVLLYVWDYPKGNNVWDMNDICVALLFMKHSSPLLFHIHIQLQLQMKLINHGY